jgi:hypothetical protein
MESDKCLSQVGFKIYVWGLLMLTQSAIFAQSPVVKNTTTDKTYANTTEIQKVKNASVEQVLNEIDKDYGLGDVVRITDAPPPKPVETTPAISRAEKPIEVTSKTPLIPTASKVETVAEVEKKTRPVSTYNTPEPPLNPIYTEGVGVKKESKTVSEKKTESVTSRNATVSKSNTKTSRSYKSSRGSSSYHKKSFFSFFRKSKPKTTKRRVPKSNGQYGCYKF